ncbi:flagellar biosynthesis anti-sigma factor FlgM [Sphingomonas sp.]
MVDPLGAKPVSSVDRARIAPVAPLTPARQAEDADARATAGLQASALVSSARDMAQKPPVDADRVAEIRKAIADGRYPLLPYRIADHMLALKMNWEPDDAA